jgi:hypothetical protein
VTPVTVAYVEMGDERIIKAIVTGWSRSRAPGGEEEA